MSDIFISYASDDRERILPLVRALENTGWSVFWDRTIPTGKHWRQVIGKEIRECRSVIVVWSKASVESEYVHEEAEEGKQRGILFPIMIDEVSPPFGFSGIQAQNLAGWDGIVPHAVFDRLIDDITKLLGVPLGAIEEEQEQKEEERRGIKELDDSQAQRPSFLPNDMILIPTGKFLYGPDKIEKDIKYDYYIDAYPVTNRFYKEFIDQTDHRIPLIDTNWAENYSWDKIGRSYPEGKDDHPVVLVSYDDAMAFCNWRSKGDREDYKLPTEEEWEKAARGIDGRKYPWGNKFDKEKCNKEGYESGGTSPVTQYPEGRSPFGCFDMVGNVCEWTDSWYDEKKEDRVLRSSSWFDIRLYTKCVNRRATTPTRRTNAIGFRCVRTVI